MKLDISKFLVENKILSTSELEIEYDLPKDKIEEIWNKLAVYYTEKSKKEFKSEILIEDFYKMLSQAKIENEIAMETFSLVKRNIINLYDSVEAKEPKFNIKRVIHNDIIAILKNRMEELKENIKNEKEVYQKIKKINLDIKIVDRQIRIYTSPFKFITYSQSVQSKEERALSCILKYKNIEFKGCYLIDDFCIVDISSFEGTFKNNNY